MSTSKALAPISREEIQSLIDRGVEERLQKEREGNFAHTRIKPNIPVFTRDEEDDWMTTPQPADTFYTCDFDTYGITLTLPVVEEKKVGQTTIPNRITGANLEFEVYGGVGSNRFLDPTAPASKPKLRRVLRGQVRRVKTAWWDAEDIKELNMGDVKPRPKDATHPHHIRDLIALVKDHPFYGADFNKKRFVPGVVFQEIVSAEIEASRVGEDAKAKAKASIERMRAEEIAAGKLPPPVDVEPEATAYAESDMNAGSELATVGADEE